MVAQSQSSGLVALFFTTNGLESTIWASLFAKTAAHIQAKLGSSVEFHSTAPQSRFLDGDPSAPRVAELRIQSAVPLSLPECKALTAKVHEAVQSLQLSEPVEIILQPEAVYAAHRTPGLAVFDMDSTLIQQEVIDELARAVGLYSEVAAITEAAMRGEEPYTDFSASLRARVALLKGVPDTVWEKLRNEVVTFTPGAPELIRVLKHYGWKTAVLSGGFITLAEWLRNTLGLDYAYANQLTSDPITHTLTGELVPGAPIVDGQKKRELLLEIAKQNGISPEHVIAVGDGSNDLPMMAAAGFGIAFNAKPKVQLAAPSSLNSPSLLDVLHILGRSKEEIEEALRSTSS